MPIITIHLTTIIIYSFSTIGRSFGQDEPTELSICATSNNKTTKISIKLDGNLCNCKPTDREPIRPPLDYNYVPEVGAYKLHLNAKTWNEARKACKREKAHMATIDSANEEIIMKKMLIDARDDIKNALSTEEALIGIHDLFKEGEWITVHGDSIFDSGYARWSSGWSIGKQPDNFGGCQNCGAITKDGGMDDVDCNAKFAFFCEIPIGCFN